VKRLTRDFVKVGNSYRHFGVCFLTGLLDLVLDVGTRLLQFVPRVEDGHLQSLPGHVSSEGSVHAQFRH
jgi:hypothetical protein